MSWTAPTTRATGDLISASIWNIDLVNNLTWISTGHGVLAFRAGPLSIATGTGTTGIALDGEDFDTDLYHDPATNNSRLTVPAGMGGLGIVMAQASWAANAAGDRILNVRKNAAFVNSGGTNVMTQKLPAPSASSAFIAQASKPTLLIAADYLEMFLAQTSGGTLAVNSGGNDTTWLALVFQGF